MASNPAQISRDDIRAAVSSGSITEAQAVSILALSERRRGAQENLEGLDEPFELFRGFNEIFIVVGLAILYFGWLTVSGIASFTSGDFSSSLMFTSAVSLAVTFLLARYFTARRRMVAPSIALAIIFASAALQFGLSLWNSAGLSGEQLFAASFALTTAFLALYWYWFRVPFSVAMVAVGVFATAAMLLVTSGAEVEGLSDFFVLTNQGPFAVLTFLLGILGFAIAMRFDMSDPHRVTRRSLNGFWLHVVSAPAIVNTVSLTLFDMDGVISLVVLLAFLMIIAAVAIVIDRRSFLVAGIGYVVALAVIVFDDRFGTAILCLGLGLVFLGATWETMRANLLNKLPDFPGKNRMPPWALRDQQAELADTE